MFWITYVKFSINNKTLHKTFRVIHTIWRPAILKLWWQGPLKISFTFFFFLLNTDIFFTWCFYINKSFTWKTNSKVINADGKQNSMHFFKHSVLWNKKSITWAIISQQNFQKNQNLELNMRRIIAKLSKFLKNQILILHNKE